MAVSGRVRAAIVLSATAIAVAALWAIGAATADRPLGRLRWDAAAGEATGSWWFPRGGPYVLGFYSSGTAELWIDDRLIARGRGLTVMPRAGRLLYERGAHAVKLKGPRSTQLLWHPPGRRGAPEYVPDSSLSPDPPSTARFGANAGTSRASGAIALLMIGVVAAGACAATRPRWDRDVVLAAASVFALALAVRVVDLGGAGQTWDEDEYWSSGRNYLVNLLRFEFHPTAWEWNYQHPPVTKYIAGIGALLGDGFGAARFLMALVGAGTCALAYAIGRRLFGATAGVVAGVICALTPHLVAHSRVVGHEAPSTFFWALALLATLRAYDAPAGWRRFAALAWAGVAMGFAVGTRFTNLLALPVVAVAMLVKGVLELPPGEATAWWRRVVRESIGGVFLGAAGAATFFASWPSLWSSPIAHLDRAYDKLKLPHLPEPYLGELTRFPEWHYFPLALLFTTPIVLLAAAFLLGPLRAAVRREWAWLIVLALLVAPFGVIRSPVRQDGVRYVLPAFVAIALAAGAGLAMLGERWRRRDARLRWIPAALVGVYLSITCFRIAPYYLDYFGEHVGGPESVKRRRLFEVGWWGEGIHEGVAYINAHAAPGAVVGRFVEPTHVTWFRGDLWPRLTEDPDAPADWLLTNDAYQVARRPGWKPGSAYEVVHDVKAQGASLVRVWRRRDDASSAPPASQKGER